jgi:hypothetical protein
MRERTAKAVAAISKAPEPEIKISPGGGAKAVINDPSVVGTAEKGLAAYGRDRLMQDVKSTFSIIRSAIEGYDAGRFAFRKLVYLKPTSNAQKSPFYAVFMAFFELMYREGLTPSGAANPPPGEDGHRTTRARPLRRDCNHSGAVSCQGGWRFRCGRQRDSPDGH